MKLRYELIDREHPTWRGPRFTDRARAERELRQAIPPGRWYLKDRKTGRPA